MKVILHNFRYYDMNDVYHWDCSLLALLTCLLTKWKLEEKWNNGFDFHDVIVMISVTLSLMFGAYEKCLSQYS